MIVTILETSKNSFPAIEPSSQMFDYLDLHDRVQTSGVKRQLKLDDPSWYMIGGSNEEIQDFNASQQVTCQEDKEPKEEEEDELEAM